LATKNKTNKDAGTAKKVTQEKVSPKMDNKFIKAYKKCGKLSDYTAGPKYVEGSARADFSGVLKLIKLLEKAGLKVEPADKASEDYEPQIYTKSGIRIGKIGIRNGYQFSSWKRGSKAVKVTTPNGIQKEADAIIALAEELEKNKIVKKLSKKVKSSKKIKPETITALKKRINNAGKSSKGIALKNVSGEIKEFAKAEGYEIDINKDGSGILKL